MRPPHGPRASPALPSRRALLGGALGFAGSAVTGCRIRLEDDAPQIPLIPTREPIPAEPALLWLLADCQALAEQQSPHTELYAEQVLVLRSALFRAGIPIDTLDEVLNPAPRTATTTATSSPRPEPTPAPQADVQADAESDAQAEADTVPDGPAAALERIEDLQGCGPGLFPLVMALLAQRWSAVSLEGTAMPESAVVPDPDRLWRFRHLAAGFVPATQAAVYGFEVVTAQSRDAVRESAMATLHELRHLVREQVARAGGSVPDPAIGFRLPFPVDSQESANALASHVLTHLADAYGALLPTVTGSAQQDSARDVVAWLGGADTLGADWGVPPTAFPGLHDQG